MNWEQNLDLIENLAGGKTAHDDSTGGCLEEYIIQYGRWWENYG